MNNQINYGGTNATSVKEWGRICKQAGFSQEKVEAVYDAHIRANPASSSEMEYHLYKDFLSGYNEG